MGGCKSSAPATALASALTPISVLHTVSELTFQVQYNAMIKVQGRIRKFLTEGGVNVKTKSPKRIRHRMGVGDSRTF